MFKVYGYMNWISTHLFTRRQRSFPRHRSSARQVNSVMCILLQKLPKNFGFDTWIDHRMNLQWFVPRKHLEIIYIYIYIWVQVIPDATLKNTLSKLLDLSRFNGKKRQSLILILWLISFIIPYLWHSILISKLKKMSMSLSLLHCSRVPPPRPGCRHQKKPQPHTYQVITYAILFIYLFI